MLRSLATACLILLILLPYPAIPQNCDNISVGLIPLNDLGTGFYRGLQGGLYPDGANVRPFSHNEAGLALAREIRPLDVNGFPDSTSGKIVLLSIGMSNTRDEFQHFQLLVDTLQQKNPYLQLVNGAQGGWDIDLIIDSTARYWLVISDTLERLGLSEQQVQAIWFKQAEAFPGLDGGDTAFVPYASVLAEKLKLAMNIIRQKFPNAYLGYVASRIYGGYANIRLNPEPFACYTGWADKFLIEDQINGDSLLAYDGPDPKAPWLSWGVYLWADGLVPRSDGLTWVCPDDFKEDGTHPSDPVGRAKVAQKLLEFFMTDETTVTWFLNEQPPVVSDIPDQSVPAGGRFQAIRMDNFVTDPDDHDSTITWSWSGNSDLQLTWDEVRRRIRVRAPHGWTGSETVTFTATDPDGFSDSDSATFKIVGSGQASAKNQLAGTSVTFLGNHPNPFNPTTIFEFELMRPEIVEIKIFDLLGREIATIINEQRSEGRSSVVWEASKLAGGIYFYRFKAGSSVSTGSVVLLK
jgi:hypothetical protein